jgi:hypothetical protein
LVVGSCDDDDIIDDGAVAYDSSYAYYGYYPADVYYSGYYWAAPYSFYYAQAPDYGGRGGGGVPGSAGTTGAAGGGGAGTSGGTSASGSMTIGDILRSLAQGQSVCPNQVTITTTTSPNACATDGSGMSRSGATITFNDCQVANGGTYNGTIDVQASFQLSDPACPAGTTVMLTINTMISNLTHTTPGGAQIMIPSSSGTTTTSYVAGQVPTTISTMLDGSMQVTGANGALTANRTFSGGLTFAPASDLSSYTVDGTLTVMDPNDASTSTLSAAGLTRSTGCCRPTAGTLTISRPSGINPGTHVWTFGATCGSIVFDGQSITAPACL